MASLIKNNKTKNSPDSLFRDAINVALAAGFLILLPFLAMLITAEMAWTIFDFAAAWILFFGAGITYKLITRKTGDIAYRIAAGIAVAAALFLVWSNLAVGLIGSENNPANAMYLGVLAILFIAVIIVRFKPYGMALALFAAALAQILVTVIAIIAELGFPENTPVQLVFINGFFVTLWAGSGLLFLYASRDHPSSS